MMRKNMKQIIKAYRLGIVEKCKKKYNMEKKQ